ncbi:MAG: DUF5915 domain-containing protein [bacterium]|nr:DUF5915 domain-containing protein [bacterium]
MNVKEIVFDKKLKDDVMLDMNITPELREEGVLRELVRMVAELRSEAGYKPGDAIALMLALPKEIAGIIERNEKFFMREVSAQEIAYERKTKFDAELETKFEMEAIWLAVRKL